MLQLTQRPSFSFVIARWWETVDWVLPTGASRSQLQAVPSGALAMRDSKRRRTGSASALKAPASSSASVAEIGEVRRGAQQPAEAGDSMVVTCFTNVLLAKIDERRYIDVCP
jgi:hypothetical protein